MNDCSFFRIFPVFIRRLIFYRFLKINHVWHTASFMCEVPLFLFNSDVQLRHPCNVFVRGKSFIRDQSAGNRFKRADKIVRKFGKAYLSNLTEKNCKWGKKTVFSQIIIRSLCVAWYLYALIHRNSELKMSRQKWAGKRWRLLEIICIIYHWHREYCPKWQNNWITYTTKISVDSNFSLWFSVL